MDDFDSVHNLGGFVFSSINPHCGIMREQKETVFEQMLEHQNQKEMRIVKMTMTKTKTHNVGFRKQNFER